MHESPAARPGPELTCHDSVSRHAKLHFLDSQIAAAGAAAAEAGRAAAFLAIVRVNAAKAALGVNYVPATPCLARVVEMATLTEALDAAYPEFAIAPELRSPVACATALPWPAAADAGAQGGASGQDGPGGKGAEGGEKGASASAWGGCAPAAPERPDWWAPIRALQAKRAQPEPASSGATCSHALRAPNSRPSSPQSQRPGSAGAGGNGRVGRRALVGCYSRDIDTARGGAKRGKAGAASAAEHGWAAPVLAAGAVDKEALRPDSARRSCKAGAKNKGTMPAVGHKAWSHMHGVPGRQTHVAALDSARVGWAGCNGGDSAGNVGFLTGLPRKAYPVVDVVSY
jgi:hypothetical protein